MNTKELETFVKKLPTNELCTMHYFLTTEVEKHIIGIIKELSPETLEVKLPVPYIAYDTVDGFSGTNRIIGIKLDKLFDDYNIIFTIREDGKTETLIPSFDLYNSIQLLEKLNEIVYKNEYEEKATKPIHFENEDIIITDPCYVIKENTDDWEKCEYGDKMEVLGIKNYKVRDTIYGDWSCTTFNTDTKEPIGKFCADAGLVGVFSLKEILEYNPDFNYHVERKWTTTLIENFTGDVWFKIDTHEGSEYNDKSVHVIGNGNINFRTEQTGL